MASDSLHGITRLGSGLIDQARQYARLMRLDRPIGTWLLLWPTLWGLWIAGSGRPQARHFLVFVAGVIVMRSAGCVINDFADRHIDGKVRRTSDRPLAAGKVAPVEALVLFAVLGLIALALLLMLNPLARLLALGAAVLTVVYPFSKRWLAAPQFVLGAAFGWGIPMAFAAETGVVPRLAWLLWLCVVVWAVIYDTMYAMADREDDLRIGVLGHRGMIADSAASARAKRLRQTVRLTRCSKPFSLMLARPCSISRCSFVRDTAGNAAAKSSTSSASVAGSSSNRQSAAADGFMA